MNNNLLMNLALVLMLLITTPSCIGTAQQQNNQDTPTKAPEPTPELPTEKAPQAQTVSSTEKSAPQLITITSEEDLQTLIKREKPLVLKLSAQWCGACKKLAPTFDALFQKLGSTYQFAQIDIDTVKSVTKKYGVAGVPAILFFNKGAQLTAHTHIGFTSEQELSNKIINAFK